MSNIDELYDRAVEVVKEDRRTSASYLQRRLEIGYTRAAEIIQRMEENGIVSAPSETGRREVLA